MVPWLFATVTLLSALKLRVRDLGTTISSPLPIFLFLFVVRVFIPSTIFAISSLIFRDHPDIVAGYVLLYSIPAAITGFIWVTIFKGDAALALTLIILDTLLAPIVVPGTVRIFLGAGIDLNMTGMALSLIFMIVLPTIVGVALNEISHGKIPAIVSPYLAPLSKIVIFFVIASNVAAVAPRIRLDNPIIWLICATCFFFIAFCFCSARLATIAGKFDREKQVSFLYTSSLKNSIAAMTLAIRYFPEYAALPAVLGVIFQQNTAAVMGRIFFGKIGGKEKV